MNNTQIEHVMAELARHLIVRKSLRVNGEENEQTWIPSLDQGLYGIYFKYDLAVSNFGYEADGNTKHDDWERHYNSIVHVIITQRHHVFTTVTSGHWNRLKEKFPAPNTWRNVTNHDSCWDSSGFADIRKEIVNAYSACFDHVPEEHRRRMIDMHLMGQFANWCFGEAPIPIRSRHRQERRAA